MWRAYPINGGVGKGTTLAKNSPFPLKVALRKCSACSSQRVKPIRRLDNRRGQTWAEPKGSVPQGEAVL